MSITLVCSCISKTLYILLQIGSQLQAFLSTTTTTTTLDKQDGIFFVKVSLKTAVKGTGSYGSNFCQFTYTSVKISEDPCAIHVLQGLH